MTLWFMSFFMALYRIGLFRSEHEIHLTVLPPDLLLPCNSAVAMAMAITRSRNWARTSAYRYTAIDVIAVESIGRVKVNTWSA